jgi:hypothetical protein
MSSLLKIQSRAKFANNIKVKQLDLLIHNAFLNDDINLIQKLYQELEELYQELELNY